MESPNAFVQLMKYAPICSKEGDGVCQRTCACGRQGTVLISFCFLLIINTQLAAKERSIARWKRGPRHGLREVKSDSLRFRNKLSKTPNQSIPKTRKFRRLFCYGRVRAVSFFLLSFSYLVSSPYLHNIYFFRSRSISGTKIVVYCYRSYSLTWIQHDSFTRSVLHYRCM